MPTVIIVTPKAAERAALRVQLETTCPQFTILGEAATSAQALKLSQRQCPDLLLLEAELPGELPFQLLETYRAEGSPPLGVIALASHAGWAYQAMEHGACAYLLRPIEAEALCEAIRRAEVFLPLNRFRQATADWLHRIYGLSGQQEVHFITLKDLIYIEARGNCTAVYAVGQSNGICIAKGFGKFIELMGDAPFLFQTSRSHLVNLFHAKRLVREEYALIMPSNRGGDIRIPVTKDWRRELARWFRGLGGWM